MSAGCMAPATTGTTLQPNCRLPSLQDIAVCPDIYLLRLLQTKTALYEHSSTVPSVVHDETGRLVPPHRMLRDNEAFGELFEDLMTRSEQNPRFIPVNESLYDAVSARTSDPRLLQLCEEYSLYPGCTARTQSARWLCFEAEP